MKEKSSTESKGNVCEFVRGPRSPILDRMRRTLIVVQGGEVKKVFTRIGSEWVPMEKDRLLVGDFAEHGAGDGGDQSPPGNSGRIQYGAWHHSKNDH